MNGHIKVEKDGQHVGLLAFWNGKSYSYIMDEWVRLQADSAKYDKGKNVILILEIDGETIDTVSIP